MGYAGICGDIAPTMENQLEKNMENEMETLGRFKGVYRARGCRATLLRETS